MDISQFTPHSPGELITVSGLRDASHAFLPHQFPPTWLWPEALSPLLLAAHQELARLDGIGRRLRDPNMPLRPLQTREAQRSSQLEGTFTRPRQQMLFELEPAPAKSAADDVNAYRADDVNAYREVANYGQALRLGLAAIQDGEPFSQSLIRNLHRTLLEGVRGSTSHPGQFRQRQVQIGRPARFVPPPPLYLPDLLDNFEQQARRVERIYDPLVEAFLMHYQFTVIHPFEDGNGRVGRMLLALMIARWCGLSNPWLYMSEYFDDNKDQYLTGLLRVSTHNDWQGWIGFCLQGVVVQTKAAERRCTRLVQLSTSFKKRINTLAGSWRLQSIADSLFLFPAVRISSLREQYGVTYPTAKADVNRLMSVGILQELPGSCPEAFYSPEILEITFE